MEKLVKLVIDTGSEEKYQQRTKKLQTLVWKNYFAFVFFVFLWKDKSFIALFHESATYIKYWKCLVKIMTLYSFARKRRISLRSSV